MMPQSKVLSWHNALHHIKVTELRAVGRTVQHVAEGRIVLLTHRLGEVLPLAAVGVLLAAGVRE